MAQFAFRIDKPNIFNLDAGNSMLNIGLGEQALDKPDSFSLVDILYLLRLCSFENEHSLRFSMNKQNLINNHVSRQFAFNK